MTRTAFFSDSSFDYETRALLGNVHYGCGDIGEMYTAIDATVDGDASSWVASWRTLADRIASIGDDSAARGHAVSARGAYLRAAAYYAAPLAFVDGVEDPDAVISSLFEAHRRCFDLHVSLLDVPGEPLQIPYQGDFLPGYLFRPSADGQPRPTLIINNGSDGAWTSIWPGVGQPALDRGYNAVIFDGPGQQSMLFERGVPFRPDWENVVTPVFDYLAARDDVEADKIALYGISQGGYWVPRALAFEHRIAAGIADTGAVDVAWSWRAQLPAPLVKYLDAGDEASFNAFLAEHPGASNDRSAQYLRWRSKPYGANLSLWETLQQVDLYRLGDLGSQITTPMLVTDPVGERFFPGQSKILFDSLSGPKVLIPFTEAEGADDHCEPMARSLVEQRMFDWLDDTLGLSHVAIP